jgi:hypothetical protein
VQLKGGVVLHFGVAAPDPYFQLDPSSEQLQPAIDVDADNPAAIVRYRLLYQSDPVHPRNIVVYQWQPLGAARGLRYLTGVYDTPPVTGPLTLTTFAHHTQLDWEAHDFPQTSYANVHRATPDRRLARVAVSSVNSTGQGPREVLRIYTLRSLSPRNAGPFNPETTAPLFHHSFLSEIRMGGRCGVENRAGFVSPGPGCAALMPPMRFEYDGSPMGPFFIEQSSTFEGPPDPMADRAFPFINSVVLMDFNRDGLPDLVQGWQSGKCTTGASHTVVSYVDKSPDGPTLDCVQGDPLGEHGSPAVQVPLRSARPILGYINRGPASFAPNMKFRLQYNCMDAGAGNYGSIPFYNLGRPAGFLVPQGAASVIGAFSEAVVAWQMRDYAPIVARPIEWAVPPGMSTPPNFALGGCTLDSYLDQSQFYPRWRWEFQPSIDWIKPGLGEAQDPAAKWYTDIDGDGLLDRLGEGTAVSRDLTLGSVAYSRYFSRQEQVAPGISGPAMVPFVSDVDGAQSATLTPRAHPLDDKERAKTRIFYVDMNGDGLVDLVTTHPDDSGGVPRVCPGDGRGERRAANTLDNAGKLRAPDRVSQMRLLRHCCSQWPAVQECVASLRVPPQT